MEQIDGTDILQIYKNNKLIADPLTKSIPGITMKKFTR